MIVIIIGVSICVAAVSGLIAIGIAWGARQRVRGDLQSHEDAFIGWRKQIEAKIRTLGEHLNVQREEPPDLRERFNKLENLVHVLQQKIAGQRSDLTAIRQQQQKMMDEHGFMQ